jgi:hypothetical protein
VETDERPVGQLHGGGGKIVTVQISDRVIYFGQSDNDHLTDFTRPRVAPSFDLLLLVIVLPTLFCTALFLFSPSLPQESVSALREKLKAMRARLGIAEGKVTEASEQLARAQASTIELSGKIKNVSDGWLGAAKLLGQEQQAQVLRILAKTKPADLEKTQNEIAAHEQSIREFERTVETAKHENDITRALARRPWMLDAGLVHKPKSKILCFKAVSTIVEQYFQASEIYADGHFRQRDGACMPDMVGWFERSYKTADGNDVPKTVFVLVEAKSYKQSIGEVAIAQAIYYASDLCKHAKPLKKIEIECYVIGASIAPGIKAQVHVFGATHEMIKIIPMTWSSLIEQARRLNPAIVTNVDDCVDYRSDSKGRIEKPVTPSSARESWDEATASSAA